MCFNKINKSYLYVKNVDRQNMLFTKMILQRYIEKGKNKNIKEWDKDSRVQA